MNRILSFLLAILLLSNCKTDTQEVIIDHPLYQRTFICSTAQPAQVSLQVQDQHSGKLLTDGKSPYFEFVISDEVVSSSHPLWVFEDKSTREMGNGGTEHKLTFKGAAGVVDGLKVIIFQQVFPGTTLIREKLVLEADGDARFELRKKDGQLHFKFPMYTLQGTGVEQVQSTEIRIASWENEVPTFQKTETGEQPEGNHMYYPDIIEKKVVSQDAKQTVKGPIHILAMDDHSWLSAYEHASQDNTRGLIDTEKVASDGRIVDAMQGTKGVFDFKVTDDDFKFLGISSKLDNEKIRISTDIIRGGYFDGEPVNAANPYETVWSATGYYAGTDLDTGKPMIRDYLFNRIIENPVSRKPEFYYNTWGMQRAIDPNMLRGVMTYENIKAEIRKAAQLGVDIFVLDDGWQETMGIWQPNKDRLPDGLSPIREELEKHGIKMGIWLSPMGIDSTTERYRQNQDWVIKDSEGDPILGQWNQPVFDFVGPYHELFIEDCKKLIDVGARFFKFDAINTFYSDLANLDHGSEDHTALERRARYEYLLPLYVTKAMKELTAYEPDLVIEVDLTEARRVMVGLAPLSQGKLFWMNNGASWYNDYTTFRTKSMRTIPNVYAGLIPLELFTYANYPQNIAGNSAYNVNTSLIAGHGFWGSLALMSDDERKAIGRKVRKSMQVLPAIAETNTHVMGQVGDSPEIYTQVNQEAATGQVIGFSGEAMEYDHNVQVNPESFGWVLNSPFTLQEAGSLVLHFLFEAPESTQEAFIMSKADGVRLTASTSWLDQVEMNKGQFEVVNGEPGNHVIHWPVSLGNPEVKSDKEITHSIVKQGDAHIIEVKTQEAYTKFVVRSND